MFKFQDSLNLGTLNIKHFDYEQLIFIFKRLAAFFYKDNRTIYHLHKSCLCKICCTLIVVILQIWCDRNYKCKKNPQSSNDSSLSDSSKENNQPQIPKRKKKMTKNKRHTERVTFHQPKSQSVTLNPTPTLNSNNSETVSFDNKTSSLQFPPSFNLKKTQKSTPIRPSTNLSCTCQIDTDSESITLKHQPSTKQNYSTRKNDTFSPKKNESDIKVEIHQETDNQSTETFHSF